MNVWGFIFIAIGIFSFCAGIFNWDWFMNARRVRFVVKILTRGGARIFYCLIGIAVIVFGILVLKGVIELQS